MAYDVLRGRTVLFGGHHVAPSTWEWDGSSWQRMAVSGPSQRAGHAMACDRRRGVVVLFGGYDRHSVGDTWEWDGATWCQVMTEGPGAQSFVAMAYDRARSEAVLFGFGGLTWLYSPSRRPAFLPADPNP